MDTVQKDDLLSNSITEFGLELQTKKLLKDSFTSFFTQSEEWMRKGKALIVTDESQVDEMRDARTARLALKEIRVNADKKRKELKEDSINYGKAVQAVYNVIESRIKPIEDHLRKQEDFVKISEEKKKNELREKRNEEISPYYEFVPFGIDLGNITDTDYERLLNGAKLQSEEKKREQERIERERIEAEKEADAERERIMEEARQKQKELAERLAKAEQERKAMGEKMKKEREKALEKLRKEQDEKSKIEAELRKKQDEEMMAKAKEAAELKAKRLAEKRLKAAPDKDKLLIFAKSLEEMQYPIVVDDEAKQILENTKILIKKTYSFIREKCSQI